MGVVIGRMLRCGHRKGTDMGVTKSVVASICAALVALAVPTAATAIAQATVPGAPTDVSGIGGDSKVTVSWTAPASNGGSAITGYRVTAFPSGKTCSTAGATSCTVQNLINGTSYTFTVVAINAIGSGSGGSTNATPLSVPGPPQNATATASNAQVEVSWAVPAYDGGAAITGYTVTAFPGGQSCSTTTATACTVTGLANGTLYSFLVLANNSVGSSDATEVTATPFTSPDAPSGVTGVAGNGAVTVSWLAPTSDGGAAITGYTVTASPGGGTCATTGDTSCTITGLTNGTSYTFTVTATNDGGSSSASDPSAGVTPFTTADAPTNVNATAGDTQATISWSAPSFDGGSSITGYTVTASPGGATCTTSAPSTECIVTGLTNGITYSFTVTATNAAGTSAASGSAAATPFTKPGAPTGVSVTVGDGQATISWTAPAFDGGSAITAYTVTASTGQTCSTAIGVSLDFTSCTVTGLENLTWMAFTVVATNAQGDSDPSDASDRVVIHSGEFQVWVPATNVNRDGGSTDVYVFGATGTAEVRLRMGSEILRDTPSEDGTVIFTVSAYMGMVSRWQIEARTTRGEGASTEFLYATAWVYAPKVSLRKSYRNGAAVVARAAHAAPGSELTMRIDGVQVCKDFVGEDGNFECIVDMDTTVAGDYTLEMYDGETLIDSRDFTIREALTPTP